MMRRLLQRNAAARAFLSTGTPRVSIARPAARLVSAEEAGPRNDRAILNRFTPAMPEFMNMLRRRHLHLGLLAVLATACDYKVAAEPTAAGQEIFQLCVQCHGADGSGGRPYNAPSIAGLPQWYVEKQLLKFRKGVRGRHWQDVGGMQMRPMAISFHNEADLKTVAAYVATLPRPVVAPQLEGGNAERGKTFFATCTACHGPDGAGNEAVKAPPLRQASDWYLARQIEHFRAGIRGADPADLEGAQMRPMAATLPDEQAIKDVVAYIASLK